MLSDGGKNMNRNYNASNTLTNAASFLFNRDNVSLNEKKETCLLESRVAQNNVVVFALT